MEEYRAIKGFESMYKVSNLGNLMSIDRFIKHSNGGDKFIKGGIKNSRLNKCGYLRSNLKNKGNSYDVLIHRLVAEAFIPNEDNKTHVNHKNGVKTDNRVENLEWVTDSENKVHAVKLRLIKTKLTDDQAIEINKSKLSNRKLAEIYNVDSTIIWRIKNNKSYKHLWLKN